MAPEKRSIGQRVDDALTRYLRNTTTDQEILDFYGEGNIIGRKGIPASEKELINQQDFSPTLDRSPFRPTSDRPDFAVGGIDQERDYDYRTFDLPDTVDPKTKRAWQMTFGELPKDFGSRDLTPAAKQFLVDFRIPEKSGSDFSFATGPNIEDRIDVETKRALDDLHYRDKPELLQEKLDEIRGQSSKIGGFSGQPATPRTWQEQGYIDQKPENLKANVLAAFKDKILERQGPFGGVSTLSPVEQKGATNPDWRADLYERVGLAGPVAEQGYKGSYGYESKPVQRFTTGNERLLPLQPYTEFLDRYGDPSKPSALGTEPAPDFTPLQKQFGTRNYLIARNIFEGRGSLGTPIRFARAAAPALADAVAKNWRGELAGGVLGNVVDPEVAFQVGKGNYEEALKKGAFNTGVGVVTGGALNAAFPALMSNPVTATFGGALALKGAIDSKVAFDAARQGYPSPEAYLEANKKADSAMFTNALGDATSRYRAPSPSAPVTRLPPGSVPRGYGIAIKDGKEVAVPWGSVAGIKKVGPKIVGKPWWDFSRFGK